MLGHPKFSFTILLMLLLLPFSVCSHISEPALAQQSSYDIPDSNGKILLISADNYKLFDGASFNDGVWFFENQRNKGIDCGLSITAKNSAITITHYSPLSFEYEYENGFWAGYLRYTVQDVGVQSFKMHNNWAVPINWHVKVDGAERPEGNGWTYSNGWITVSNATSTVVLTPQLLLKPVAPKYDDGKPYFDSTDLNCTITFSDKISFSKNWVFNPNITQFQPPTANGKPNAIFFKTTDNNDPTLSRSSWWRINNIFFQTPGVSGARELVLKARDTKVTVNDFSQNQTVLSQKGQSTTHLVDEWLNYSVLGIGQQSAKVNLPLNWTTHSPNIAVYIDGIARQNGDGWHIQSDDTETWLTVSTAKSNVSIHTWMEYTAGQFGGLYVEVYYTYIVVVLAIILAPIFVVIIVVLILRRKRSRKSTSIDVQASFMDGTLP